MSTPPLRLGTRGSQLALYQARTVASLLAAQAVACEVVVIKTSGDRLQAAPLSEVGGKRLFVKEIEDALGNGMVDLAVHSSKDMPADLADGLDIAGVLPREDARDAVVLSSASGSSQLDVSGLQARLRQLTRPASIGTSSVRRIAQLTHLFPGARFAPIRGNLDTRLRKVDEGEYDALVLAAAGLRRLGFAARISLALPLSVCVPAPGQGIIAIETRRDDHRVRGLVAAISDPSATDALSAERSLVEALGGGCQTPIGAYATLVDNGVLELVGIVAALDGSLVVRASARAERHDARGLGLRVAEQLVEAGALDILDTIRSHGGSPAT